jgi:hypothetical protein
MSNMKSLIILEIFIYFYVLLINFFWGSLQYWWYLYSKSKNILLSILGPQGENKNTH